MEMQEHLCFAYWSSRRKQMGNSVRKEAGTQEAHRALSHPGSRCDFEGRRHQVRLLLPLTHRGADQFVVAVGIGHRVAHDLVLLLTGGMIDHAAEGTEAGHEHQGKCLAAACRDLPPQVLQTYNGSSHGGHCVMLHKACNGLLACRAQAVLIVALVCFPSLREEARMATDLSSFRGSKMVCTAADVA